jgi:hypothetical protein
MSNQIIGTIIHESVTESESTIIGERNHKAYATGILQDLGIENRNGRTYEISEMKPEVEGDRIQKELIPAGYMRGHAGHPSSTELSVQSVVDPKICCVQFDKIWMDGNLIRANFHGTNNEYGKAFNEDLLEGCKPAFSLRALGSVDRSKNGKCYVKNIRIITWDHVIYPSHKRAYTSKIIDSKDADQKFNESAILLPNNNKRDYYKACMVTESVSENGLLIPVLNEQVVSYIKSESANVKSILNTFDTLYESAILVNDGKNVALTLRDGNKIMVNLEQYIQDEIMNWCFKN